MCCNVNSFLFALRSTLRSKQESNFSNYVKRASDIYHGITTTDMRRLAYQYATPENCIVPLLLPYNICHREVHSFTLCLSTVIFFSTKIWSFDLSVSFRVHFKEYFLNSAPLGSAGSANKSGWMSTQDFVLFVNTLYSTHGLRKRTKLFYYSITSAVSV
jgi:hypothetical protein